MNQNPLMEETAPKEITLNILALPKEILNIIVHFVPKEDLRSSVRLASRTFFHLVRLSEFSIGVIMLSEMEQFAQIFGRYQKPISLALNKPDKLFYNPQTAQMHFTTLTQLESLRIGGDFHVSQLIHFPKLASLDLADGPVIQMSTLQHLTKLTRLVAEVVKDGPTHAFLTNLLELDLKAMTQEWTNMTCHKVTSLVIRTEFSPPQEWLAQFKLRDLTIQHWKRSSALPCQVPAGSIDHLTSLTIHHVSLLNKTDIPWHQLKELSFYFTLRSMDMSALRQVPKCTSLTSLNINAVTNQEMVEAIDVHELKQLRSFTMLIGGNPPFGSVKNLLRQFNKTLKTLQLTVYQDHEECFTELSKMTKLESLQLYVRHTIIDYEPVELSALVTMTHLTTLKLRLGRYIGLDRLGTMTNLRILRIISESPDQPLERLNLAAFTSLTNLELTRCVNVVNLHGATQLKRFVYDAPIKVKSAIELVPDELRNLKEISIGSIGTPIPWSDIAKLTALEDIAVDVFETDDSITILQNLRRLTHIGNVKLFTNSFCTHFDANYLAHLTRLQRIELTVPNENATKQILESKLPRLCHLRESVCLKCKKKAKEELKAQLKQQAQKDLNNK